MTQDYTLTGDTARAAIDRGLASPAWYRTPVDPAEIRKLMAKSDAVATRDTVIWLGAMLVSVTIAIALWPSWWSAPFWLVYGVLYGSASDARWHECGHKTAFATSWKNTVVYHIASFMLLRNPYAWRASHVRHHADTIIVGRDPEIVAMRPPDLLRVVLNLFGIVDTWHLLRRMVLHASGRIHREEATYVRAADHPKMIAAARITLGLHLTVVVLSLWSGSILPLMVVGLPRLYGAWHHVLTGLIQHLGLAENVTDHRLNTRTVMMNPVSRFIYLNMNYHLEHHMFTMVPYYHLPALHALIRHDTPEPDPSVIATFRRLLPVLLHQLRDEKAVIIPVLPATATPYRAEVDALRPHAI